MISNSTINIDIAEVVSKGLASTPKRLPSWLFYDEAGDKIFQAIMHMPEYYLTKSEYQIMKTHKDAISRYVEDTTFKLVELGAGDGLKTEILLQHFLQQGADFTYVPVDVSFSILSHLQGRLADAAPDLKVNPINKRYHDALADLKEDSDPKLVLFLGANIGNFSVKNAQSFVRQLAANMSEKDQLLVGFDLKKDPRQILRAYDDTAGITKAFNLNLLCRLNRELGANFNVDSFSHFPFYDPDSGLTKSYLVSQEEQDVTLEVTGDTFHFNKWEVLHTELSQKYDLEKIDDLSKQAGLRINEIFYDQQKWFCDVLFSRY